VDARARSNKHINDRRSPAKGLGGESPVFLLRLCLLRPGPTTARRCAPQPLERFSGMGMDAVAAILVFLVAMLALNRFEFGRFD
jgi:hypothetical protein